MQNMQNMHPIRSCFRVFMHTCGWSILRSVTPMLNPSIVHSIHMLVFVDVLLVFVCVCVIVCVRCFYVQPFIYYDRTS